MEFCNKNKSPELPEEENNNMVINECQEYQKLPAHQNELHTFDSNASKSVSTSSKHLGEYHPFMRIIIPIFESPVDFCKYRDLTKTN